MSAILESPPRKVSSEIERKRMIRERQENSTTWRVIHLLGSLKLALTLLGTIAAACAIATFCESGFSTKVARTYIYQAPWFTVWLGVLCVNLFAVTLTRWPWQKKHIGFVVTHYGIITLLTGAIIGHYYGYEGNVTLHTNKPPLSRIITSRSVLEVQSPADNGMYLLSFDAETPTPTKKRPRVLPIPGSTLKLVVDDFNNNMQRVPRLLPASDGSAGIVLKMQSSMLGRTMELPFLLQPETAREQDFFGLAKISFLPDLPKEITARPIETQMVFAKFAPVVHSAKAASQIMVLLSKDGNQVTVQSPDGTGATYLRAEVMEQPIVTGNATVRIRQYWPDFVMRDGKPSSASEKPNNPAALVDISAVDPQTATSGKPQLTLAPLPNGRIAYQLSRSGVVSARGELTTGETFRLGWADWTATVEQSLPLAALTEEAQPGKTLPANEKAGVPGFHAYLQTPAGEKSPALWTDSGSVATLRVGDRSVTFGYGLEIRPIPFTIGLLNFTVPRDEGTDTPSNFIATVEFKDPRTGETNKQTTRMNHPASFPGRWWNTLTGINYKFSQAEWNPQDLGETTLQVLYDPGWLLKWMGSLGICAGIAIMFYWKPGK